MRAPTITAPKPGFLEEIDILRRDDHRLYHQSRINQTLHLISACCFLVTYGLFWFNPAEAVILGWLGGMLVRQTGHFVFEPTGFDRVNNLSNAAKESIKVGFNVYRKIALLILWAAIPLVLWLDPTCQGLLAADRSADALVNHIGWGWLLLAAGGLLARSLWLMCTRNVQTGVAWFAKILSDPFHNVREYWRSPLFLIRGQLIEPLAPVTYYAPGADSEEIGLPAGSSA